MWPKNGALRQEDHQALGDWQGNDFQFKSSAAREKWIREAYRQGVNAHAWHLGEEVDDKTRDAIVAAVSGPAKAIYLGPDRKYRFLDRRTVEDSSTRAHRNSFFAGKSFQEVAEANVPPGEDELVRKLLEPGASNDNHPTVGVARKQNSCPTCETGYSNENDRGQAVSRKSQQFVRSSQPLVRVEARDAQHKNIVSRSGGVWDWLFRGDGSCPEPDCEAVHDACQEKCLELTVDKGHDSDTPLRYRRCVRECMADQGCFSY